MAKNGEYIPLEILVLSEALSSSPLPALYSPESY